MSALEQMKQAFSEVVPERANEFESISLDAPIADVALDSVSLMEIVGAIEDKTKRMFADGDLARVQCLRDILVLMERTG